MANKTRPTRRVDALPDGKHIADYDGHRQWTSERWAWEFLRRNPTLIDACDELATLADAAEDKEARQLVALLFGLDRFKPYTEGYGTGKPPKFEAADIYVYATSTKTIQKWCL